MTMCYFFRREACGDIPAGWTVSKTETLPSIPFGITEYGWGAWALWFVDSDDFTPTEREAAWWAFRQKIRDENSWIRTLS